MIKTKHFTEEQICQWLIPTVARLARVDPSALGPDSSFEELGLSSLAAVTLSTELSDHLAMHIDPMVTWDYPTIRLVARAIAEGVVGGSRPA